MYIYIYVEVGDPAEAADASIQLYSVQLKTLQNSIS
jgi:hypothetical protein